MAIFHGAEPVKDFGKMPNGWNRDARLSIAETGMLSYLKSHRSGYHLTVEQMVAEFADGKDAVRAALNGLIEKGYVRREYERDRGRVVAVHYLVIGADGEFPQVEATSGKAGNGLAGSGVASGDEEFAQVGATSGKTGSGSASSGESAPKKTSTKKTTDLEDQEDENRSELNWRTADAAREPKSDLPSLVGTDARPTSTFEDWRGPDYDLFRFFLGSDRIYSDGTVWTEGEHNTAAFYRAFQQRPTNPMRWPGRYFDEMNTTDGVETYLASQGLEPA